MVAYLDRTVKKNLGSVTKLLGDSRVDKMPMSTSLSKILY